MQNSEKLDAIKKSIDKFGDKWKSINPESVRRLRMQNRLKTGLEIAKYTAKIMRRDMDLYDKNPSMFTQSLGCWHGFIGQQKMISIKKHFGKMVAPQESASEKYAGAAGAADERWQCRRRCQVKCSAPDAAE